jgi:glutathione S-transferase
MAARTPNIHLYTTQTPNGVKISITLEELGIPYEFTRIDISKDTQKEPWFREINPNGRIPALTDTFADGESIRLFESGSIQQYLVEQYDHDHKISYPKGSRESYEVNNWVSSLAVSIYGWTKLMAMYSFSLSMLELGQCKDKPTILLDMLLSISSMESTDTRMRPGVFTAF